MKKSNTWVYQGNWVRFPECRIDGEHILYAGEVVRRWNVQGGRGYSVFDHYYPGGKGPQGERSIYLEFASLPPDKPSKIIDFLKRYGPLGVRAHLNPGNYPPNEPDPLKDVQNAIATFAAVLKMCEALEKDDKSLLKSLPGPILVAHQGTWHLIRAPQALDRAALAIETLVGRALEKVPPSLSWDAGEHQWIGRWTFHSLLAAFYIMLSLDLQGSGLHRQCPLDEYGCGAFFVAERPDNRYCSPKCQQRAKVYRMRAAQEKAKKLHQEGVPIEGIAKQLDKELKTIKAWIEETKHGKKTR